MTVCVPEVVKRHGPEAVDRYTHSVSNGESPRLAEMLALQKGPGIMTDSVFYAGVGTLDKQIKCKNQLQKLVQAARRQGYNPSPNDFYCPTLARKFGDREAFISGGRGQAKEVLRKRGWEGEGAVSVKGQEPITDPTIPKHKLNPKIVNRLVNQKIKADPSLKLKDRRELAEAVIDKHGKK